MSVFKLLIITLCLCLAMPALAKKRARVKQTKLPKREAVTVSFAADEGWEEAEKARAAFLRKSRERRQAQERAEAAKRPKKVQVKAEKRTSPRANDELEEKASKKEIGLAWRGGDNGELHESSLDFEIDDLNSAKFDISPEERAELNELLRQPSSDQPKDAVAPASSIDVTTN